MKDIKPIEPSELEEIAIEELIIRQFEESNTKLELFDDKKISLALDCYVEKDEKNIINETLKYVKCNCYYFGTLFSIFGHCFLTVFSFLFFL